MLDNELDDAMSLIKEELLADMIRALNLRKEEIKEAKDSSIYFL